MSPTRESKVIVLLPVSDETQKRRANVKVELTLGYTVLGYPIHFAHIAHFPARPDQKAFLQEYCANDIGRLLNGWKAGQGAPHFKTQRLRVLPPGFEGIEQGLKIMRDGAYGREKLICKIA